MSPIYLKALSTHQIESECHRKKSTFLYKKCIRSQVAFDLWVTKSRLTKTRETIYWKNWSFKEGVRRKGLDCIALKGSKGGNISL